MLNSSINIDGLAQDIDLGELALDKCRTFDYNVKLPINIRNGIKDIYQVSLNSSIESTRIINLKDSTILLLKGITNYKILAVENSVENNINYLEEQSFFNASLIDTPLKNDNIDVYIIDANFSLITNFEVNCSLTYLFAFKSLDYFNNEASTNEEIGKYNLIDITREFN